MSNKPNTHHRETPNPPKRPRPATAAVAVALIAAVALGVVVAASLSNESSAGQSGDPRIAAPVRTGETNAMGMPVVTTPGSASGTAVAGGVEVTGVNWDMGRVPLNVAVRPSWTLRNISNATVTLGEPKSEVRQGCCPGPFTVGARTLAPGESTEVTFELSMHPGMDGPHDLAVHVPVQGLAGADHLTLSVAGDFR